MDRRSLLIIIFAVVLRLGLFTFFPSLPELLTNRVELSTPVTSFKRLQEGLFLYTHGVSPYDGGIFHQAPLLLAFFTSLPSSSVLVHLIYTLCDVLSSLSLITIATSKVAAITPLHTSSRASALCPPWAAAAAFLLNPFTIATCLSRSTIVFSNTVILASIAKAVSGDAIPAMLALSMASYLSLYPVLILPAVVLLCYDMSGSKLPLCSYASQQCGVFFTAIAGLLGLSWMITGGSWEFLKSTYGVHLLLPDLTPNVGLWWYFFIEMFDSFRNFFLCVFQLHLVIYVGGLCIRLRKQPLFVCTTMLGIMSIFKSYPSIGDTALYLSLLACYRHVFPVMRYTFFATSTLLYATLLGPAFYYLWIYAGSGNANFFYAITLVWCLAVTVIVADALFAVIRDEWETERPDMKGKDIVQI
ncbi:GPI transamidase subunit PIG-U [Pyronema omphalodes]|nr:GPI transamidase subunit PIG-U [Pyronema omphalodes]